MKQPVTTPPTAKHSTAPPQAQRNEGSGPRSGRITLYRVRERNGGVVKVLASFPCPPDKNYINKTKIKCK